MAEAPALSDQTDPALSQSGSGDVDVTHPRSVAGARSATTAARSTQQWVQAGKAAAASAKAATPSASVLTTSPEQLLAELPTPTLQPTQRWRQIMHLGPDQATVQRERWNQVMRTSPGRALTILVCSPKGGTGKTPTSIGLAAAFGAARSNGVLAWDNNETRGTLVDRVELTTTSTVADLLHHAPYFASGRGGVAELETVLNRQGDGNFAALGSDQHHSTVSITGENVNTIHEVLRKFFSIIIIDSGNNESAENFQAALRLADVLVVPVGWKRDSVVPAMWMLHAMNNAKLRTRGNTIIVATGRSRERDPDMENHARQWFSDYPIVEVAEDPAIGTPKIRWSAMRDTTRDAYREAGALAMAALLANPNPGIMPIPSSTAKTAPATSAATAVSTAAPAGNDTAAAVHP